MHTAILWDNDGVLVNSEQLFYEANKRYFAQHGIQLSHAQFFDLFLHSNTGAWHLIGYENDEQIRQGRQQRNAIYTELLTNTSDLTMAGIDTVLQEFATRCRMAIVTSSERHHFDQIHHRTNVLQHFEFVVAAGDYQHEKPNPEPYLTALTRLALPAHACIAIEDSPRGLAAAHAAGLRCVVIRSELTKHHVFKQPYAIVDSSSALRDVLDEWHNKLCR